MATNTKLLRAITGPERNEGKTSRAMHKGEKVLGQVTKRCIADNSFFSFFSSPYFFLFFHMNNSRDMEGLSI